MQLKIALFIFVLFIIIVDNVSKRLRKAYEDNKKALEKARETNEYMSRLLAAYLLTVVDKVEETGNPVKMANPNPTDSLNYEGLLITKGGVVGYPSVTAMGYGRGGEAACSLEEFRNYCKSLSGCNPMKFEPALNFIENSWVKTHITTRMLRRKLASLER